jgi:hypothetical protein
MLVFYLLLMRIGGGGNRSRTLHVASLGDGRRQPKLHRHTPSAATVAVV